MQHTKVLDVNPARYYSNYNYISVSEFGKKRDKNEDAVGIFHLKEGLLTIICDGLGGGLSGEFASRVSVEKIHKSFIQSKEMDLIKRIKQSIESANHFVFEKSNGNLQYKGMATTCEVLLINSVNAYWGHVGDSRIYHFNKKKLTQLTKDHSITQKLLDEGELSFKEYHTHPKKSIVTKAIGDSRIPEVDSSKMLLTKQVGSKFLVCTDGVTCVVSNYEITKLLENDDLNEISENLSRLISGRGAPDNFSYVIISA
jgi:protein phosphatase